LLEGLKQRRLLEKRLYGKLDPGEEDQIPNTFKVRPNAHLADLVNRATQDVDGLRVSEGRATIQRIKERLEARSR
jgi:hypothetical protein